jgi:hypothetical protein
VPLGFSLSALTLASTLSSLGALTLASTLASLGVLTLASTLASFIRLSKLGIVVLEDLVALLVAVLSAFIITS